MCTANVNVSLPSLPSACETMKLGKSIRQSWYAHPLSPVIAKAIQYNRESGKHVCCSMLLPSFIVATCYGRDGRDWLSMKVQFGSSKGSMLMSKEIEIYVTVEPTLMAPNGDMLDLEYASKETVVEADLARILSEVEEYGSPIEYLEELVLDEVSEEVEVLGQWVGVSWRVVDYDESAWEREDED